MGVRRCCAAFDSWIAAVLNGAKLVHQTLQRQLGNVNFELRDVVTKSKFPAKFRPNDHIECVRLEGRRLQCLYTEGAAGGLMGGAASWHFVCCCAHSWP